jgi:hypothetical protein
MLLSSLDNASAYWVLPCDNLRAFRESPDGHHGTLPTIADPCRALNPRNDNGSGSQPATDMCTSLHLSVHVVGWMLSDGHRLPVHSG